MPGTVSTVLTLIFSVALLVLSMAVSQFGPRILHRFVRDGITHSARRCDRRSKLSGKWPRHRR